MHGAAQPVLSANSSVSISEFAVTIEKKKLHSVSYMETTISGRDLWGLQIGKNGGNSDKRIFVGKEECLIILKNLFGIMAQPF